jgi:hypothetical protein
MDFDPRDYDSRDDDRSVFGHERSGRGHSDDDLERDHDVTLTETRGRDRDDTRRDLGRGPRDAKDESRDARAGRSAIEMRMTRSRTI